MMQIVYILLIGSLGLILHWAKKYKRKQTTDSLREHIFDNSIYSIGSLSGFILAMITLASQGIDLSEAKDIATIVLSGYSSDSLFNKNSDQ